MQNSNNSRITTINENDTCYRNTEDQYFPVIQSWYYEINGKTFGPCSIANMKTLIEQGNIRTSSYVWSQQMERWTLAIDTILSKYFVKERMETRIWYYIFNGNCIGPVERCIIENQIIEGKIFKNTLLWSKGMEEWRKADETEFMNSFQKKETPPPLNGAEINNSWVWWLAFAPILSEIAYQIIGTIYLKEKLLNGSLFTDYANVFSTLQILSIAITLGINIFISYQDLCALKKSGNNVDDLNNYWLIPVYLFKRAKKLEQTPSYAIVWCVCMLIFIL